MDQDQLEKAKIAIEEYRVLHAEILQRSTVLMQIVAGGMAAIVGLIGLGATAKLEVCTTLGLIFLVLVIIIGAWWFVRGDAMKASNRIIEIEKFVNSSVGGDEINPLSWERRFGLAARGTFARIIGK